MIASRLRFTVRGMRRGAASAFNRMAKYEGRLCGAFCGIVRSWLAYQSQRHITLIATEEMKLHWRPMLDFARGAA
jgi:hypothetical protein